MFSEELAEIAKKNEERSKLSEADKMFEELGYIKGKTNNALGYINEIGTEFILFLSSINEPPKICINKDYTEYTAMSIQELQAINKKVEEMKWEKKK